jgi:peptidoglycan/LPS O-acetylase OafA/YrhL
MKAIRTDIQALRGIAVLLVVLHHLGIRLRAGYLGVDVFFVISGFLITSLVRDAIQRGDFSFTEFYFRRAKRLLPAAYATFFVTALLSTALLGYSELWSFAKQLLGAVTFTGNVALWRQTGYFASSAELKPLLHVWSLAIEEQYYLLLPAALAWCPRAYWRLGASLVVVASLATTIVAAPAHPSAAFYLLPTRAWELGLGTLGALGLGRAGHVLAKLFWPALAALFVVPFFPFGGPHPGLDAAVVCVATLAVILRHHEAAGESRPARILAWFGDFSYSLYLVHWPVIALANNAWIGEMPAAVRVALVVSSVALARLLYRTVEEPLRRARFGLSARFVGTALAASVAIVLVPFGALVASGRGEELAGARAPNLGLHPSCDQDASFTARAECRTAERPRILVWGDSHAMHLVPGIAQTSGDLGVLQATKVACGPTLGLAPVALDAASRYGPEWAAGCMRFNRSVVDHLAGASSIEVVVLSSALTQYLDAARFALLNERGERIPPGPEPTIEHLRRTVEAVRALGKRVIVVAPPPSAGFDVGSCIERRETGKWSAGPHADCAFSASAYRELRGDVIALRERLSREAPVNVVDFDELLCGGGVCRAVLDEALVYRDAGHLTASGSVIVAARLGLATKLLAEAD